jgi:hypothetical protein
MLKLSCVFLILLISTVTKAQLNKAETEDQITNGKSREWLLADYKLILGTGCQGDGELYTFYKNGKVQRKRCVDGKLEYKELDWALRPVGPESDMEWQIVFSEPLGTKNGYSIKAIRVDLPSPRKNTPKQQMIWRDPPQSKLSFGQALKLISKN